MATLLYNHFRRDLFANVAGGMGLSVLFRSESTEENGRPLDIPLDDAHISVVMLLVSSHIEDDPNWTNYVHKLLNDAVGAGLSSRVIPIAIDGAGLRVLGDIQALRWDTWTETGNARELRLINALTYELC